MPQNQAVSTLERRFTSARDPTGEQSATSGSKSFLQTRMNEVFIQIPKGGHQMAKKESITPVNTERGHQMANRQSTATANTQGGNQMAKNQPKFPIERIFASVRETADSLSVSKGTVYGLMKKGLLDYRKIGSRRVVPIPALHAYAQRLGK